MSGGPAVRDSQREDGDQDRGHHEVHARQGEALGAGLPPAERAGAVQAEHQAEPRWRVLLDPAGHPFCITTVTPPDGPPALGPEDVVF